MWPRSRREHARGSYVEDEHISDTSLPSHIGRFRLEDQILGSHGQRLWRAYDERLNRMVALRLVDPDDPLHDDLRAAACAAARVVDRSVVQVLDVLDFEGTLVIVTEWVSAIPLEQLLTTAMTPAQSVEVTRRVGEAISHIHAAGITHGRVRPASVMIDKEGEVRLRGHMIDARIYGIEPGSDPAAADISGLGAIMTACLTGRWPGSSPTALPAVPIVAGKRAVPSQLRADLPDSLDTFVIRAMAAVSSPETIPSRHAFPDAPSALECLAGIHEGSGSLRHLHRRPSIGHRTPAAAGSRSRFSQRVKRVAAIGGIVAAAFAVGIAGSRLFLPSEEDAAAVAPPVGANAAIRASGGEVQGASETRSNSLAAPTEQILPITGVLELKANGKGVRSGSGSEAAIDGNAVSAWRTPLYKQPTTAVSEASGVIVDLGEVRQIRAVNIGLLGNNSGLELRVAEKLGKKATDYQLLQNVRGAGTTITLREAQPLATRYVLVVLTSVPKAKGKNYQGGISSIQVVG